VCAPQDDALLALQQEFGLLSDHLNKDIKRAQKLEAKLDITLGGYQRKVTQLQQETSGAYSDLLTAEQELACFRALQAMEHVALPLRLQVSAMLAHVT